MPWYLHLYHLAWLLFFIGLGMGIGWWVSGTIFSVIAVTIFMRG